MREDARPVAWTDADLANPHAVEDKSRRVRWMFGAIAPSYDLNNRLHSLWRDQAWRRAAVRAAQVKPSDVVVDVACGTGDLSLAFAQARPARVLGVDFTQEMLAIARQKGHRPRAKGQAEGNAGGGPSFLAGDAMCLPLPDACCDIVSIAFGIRNVALPGAALAEFHRVLRPGGRLVILEFSLPANRVLRGVYQFYFTKVLPRTASLIARDRSGAYKYLPRSVNTFLDRRALMALVGAAGFRDVTVRALTAGIAVIYRGVKD